MNNTNASLPRHQFSEMDLLKLAWPCNLWGNVFNLVQIIYKYNVTFYKTVKIGAESYYNVLRIFFQLIFYKEDCNI
jgi:hypothetical protein